MVEKTIAICLNEKIFKHSGSWVPVWIAYCEKNNVPYEIIDCYKYDIIQNLPKYSALIWGYSNYVVSDLMEAQNILNIAQKLGLKVFPNYNTGWHFDDKIAEMYALQSVNAPIPQSWVFYLLDECIDWLKTQVRYPLIAKLRCGSGSNNIKKLNSEREAIKYAKKLCLRGVQPAPSLVYKAFSKIQSTRDLKTFISRVKRIPEFLNTRKHGKQMPVEKGYCYFQEYIKNKGFDIKVVVIKDKLSYFVRKTRIGDFRASGGGDFFYDKTYIGKQIIDSAFAVADALGMQCVGFDYVVDEASGQGLIIEMCYGFDWEAVLAAGGYFDRSGNWYNEPLNVPYEVIKNLLENTLNV